jgi:hypothetical protein
MDINADAQEVIKRLGDRLAALSIEIEILRTAYDQIQKELNTERAGAQKMAEHLLKYVSAEQTKLVTVDEHSNIGQVKPPRNGGITVHGDSKAIVDRLKASLAGHHE